MKIGAAADERTRIAALVVEDRVRRGDGTLHYGALRDGERHDWALASEAASRDVEHTAEIESRC